MPRFLTSFYWLSWCMSVFIGTIIISLSQIYRSGQVVIREGLPIAQISTHQTVFVTIPTPFNKESQLIKTVDVFLTPFIDKLINIRTVHLKNLQEWVQTPNTTDLIDADSDIFLARLRNLTALQTITVNISLSDFFKKFPWIGYEYGGNNCNLLEAKSEYGNDAHTYNAGYGKRYYKGSCKGNITSLIKQIPFEGSILDVGYLPFLKPRKEDPKETIALTYLHVAQNAIVNMDGDAFFGKYKLCPQRCMASKNLGGKPGEGVSLHKEIFTIAQFWGEGFYHFMNEELPRLAAWVTFLKRYPEIKIHVHSNHGFISSAFQGLGLKPDRVVTGHVRAQLLYIPAGTPCGAPSYFNSKLQSLRLQKNIISKPVGIKSHLQNASISIEHSRRTEIPTQVAAPALASNSKSSRNYIVMIRRSTKRYFNNHDDIFQEVVHLANNYGLQVKLFDDRKLPSYNDTVEMFYNAVAIVGPHGAGMSNVFYSQPGTVIVEGLCYNGGVANLCYRNLAKNIGLRYYGVLLKDDCFNTKPNDIVPALKTFLDLLYIQQS